jgi:hypothetical protein
LRKPVDAAMLSHPVANPDMIRMRVLRKAGSLGLLGGKEALLRLGDLV